MKTRRIFLQPGEPVEIINSHGTSILKVTAPFEGTHACAVIYEQPDIITLTPAEAKLCDLNHEPLFDLPGADKLLY